MIKAKRGPKEPKMCEREDYCRGESIARDFCARAIRGSRENGRQCETLRRGVHRQEESRERGSEGERRRMSTMRMTMIMACRRGELCLMTSTGQQVATAIRIGGDVQCCFCGSFGWASCGGADLQTE